MTPANSDLESVAQSLTAERAAIGNVLERLRAIHAESTSISAIPEWAGIAQRAFAGRTRALEGVLAQACDALDRASAGATQAIGTIAASAEKK